jgi:hypothetical protein
MNLSQLRAVQPEQLTASATSFRRAKNMLELAADRVDLEVVNALSDGSWQGTANQAATGHVQRAREQLTEAQTRMGAADKAVWQFAEAVTAAKRTLADAERTAELEQLELGEDGSVGIPALPWPTTEQDQLARQRAAEEAHGWLNQALAAATEADVTCARVLAELDVGAAGESTAGGGGAESGDDATEGGGGDGILDQIHGLFYEDGEGFDDSILGHYWDVWTDSDRSIMERIFPTEDIDWFGDLEGWQEDWIRSSPIGNTMEDLLGEDVVERIHEDGLVAAPDAIWDDFYDGVTGTPDRIQDGVEDLIDDPVGTVGGWFD